MSKKLLSLAALGALCTAFPALADGAPTLVETKVISAGDTAWMMTSTALVLFMTIPGLALFYAGMVRKKNVLATLMQSFAICALITVLWTVVGYSLAFTPGNSLIGGLDRILLDGMLYLKDEGKLTVHPLAGTIPEAVFHDLPDDLCHHHASTHYRCLCRTHEVFHHAGLHGTVVSAGLCTGSALGMGTRRLDV